MLSKAEKFVVWAQRKVELRLVQLIVVDHDDLTAVSVHTNVVEKRKSLTHDLVVGNEHRAFSLKLEAFHRVAIEAGLNHKDLPSASLFIEGEGADGNFLVQAIVRHLHSLSGLGVEGEMVLSVGGEFAGNLVLKVKSDVPHVLAVSRFELQILEGHFLLVNVDLVLGVVTRLQLHFHNQLHVVRGTLELLGPLLQVLEQLLRDHLPQRAIAHHALYLA